MPSKIKILVDSIEQYDGYNKQDSVEDRLDKTLDLYINELDNTCKRVLSKKRKDLVMKELNK